MELGKREKELLRILVTGVGNKVIAQEMDIETGTVKEYIGRLFKKTGCSNRTDLAVWAYNNPDAIKE